MIVIEGPDGCGKTTAAKRICQLRPDFQFRHMGPPEKEGVKDHVKWYIDNFDRWAVWDRYHIGEEVYGYLGLSQCGTPDERAKVRRILKDQETFVVIMFASDFSDLRHKDAVQIYSDKEIQAVNERFHELASEREYCTYSYDISRFGFPCDVWLKAWVAMHNAPR